MRNKKKKITYLNSPVNKTYIFGKRRLRRFKKKKNQRHLTIRGPFKTIEKKKKCKTL